MFRSICSIASRLVTRTLAQNANRVETFTQSKLAFSQLSSSTNINGFKSKMFLSNPNRDSLLTPSLISPTLPLLVPNRTVTKFSLRKGKRKSVKTVTKRFFRLHWGGWIRTMAGRDKHLWKKSFMRKKRAQRHVLCNSTQSKLLDKMVTKFWRKPKYYVDDIYAPYHQREEFWATRRKPTVREQDL